jgi:hypothetical protein
LAILRLDGDLYESTMDALVNLYPKLSPVGYASAVNHTFLYLYTRDTYRSKRGAQ